ncbi:hypothetical protein [Helicobacter acinonychis]|uniref:hypothetical protein n=1 Tax=Helicobacter acinonychis TaxID=212 RepID=UPI001F3D540D|nr:hypothetical protein [Helicobacter acinonychis]
MENVTVLIRYFSRKIDEMELCERIEKTNTTLLSGGVMAGIGQLAIPIPRVGAMIGAFVGAALSQTFYDISLRAFKEAKLVHQRCIEIEEACRANIGLLEIYQNQFKEVFEQYFHGNVKFFNESFDELKNVLYAGDTDLAIAANNKSQEWLGQKPLFDNSKEGWDFITSRGRTEI